MPRSRKQSSREEAIARLESLSMPEPNSGCWLWMASTYRGGYGQASYRGKQYRAPRLSYLLFVGEIPAGLVVRHKCDNPPCINPDHLELGTDKDNSEDRVKRGRTPKGSKNPGAKLSYDQVVAIRSDSRPYKRIAADYGVSAATVCMVKQRKHWAHVPERVNANGDCPMFVPLRKPKEEAA